MGVGLALAFSAPGIVAGLAVLHQGTKDLTANVLLTPPAAKPVRWLASKLEEKTYRSLCRAYLAPNFVISAHMPLLDVIGRDQAARLSKRDREFAWRDHCDFVIVRTRDLSIARVIEVNGRFHGGAGQMLRDRRKRLILQRFGIPMQVVDEATENQGH